jgi:hypothetical protein
MGDVSADDDIKMGDSLGFAINTGINPHLEVEV